MTVMPFTQENESNASPQLDSKKSGGMRGSFRITPYPDDPNLQTAEKRLDPINKRGSVQIAITPTSGNGTQKKDTMSTKARQSVTLKTEENELKREDEGNVENFIPQESKVGKKLSDLTTRRVIILVLSMLIT